MKNLIILAFVCMYLSSCHQNLGAVDLKPVKSQNQVSKSEKMTDANQVKNNSIEKMNLVKGKSFSSDREEFVVLPELYSTSYQPSEDTQSNSLSAKKVQQASELVQKKGGFAIYKSSSVNTLSSTSSVIAEDQTLLPVVLNKRTNNLGILTGKIKVVLNDMGDVGDIATDLNLTIADTFSHLKTVFFIVNGEQDLIDLSNTLDNDSRIKSASIEVLENFYEPH